MKTKKIKNVQPSMQKNVVQTVEDRLRPDQENINRPEDSRKKGIAGAHHQTMYKTNENIADSQHHDFGERPNEDEDSLMDIEKYQQEEKQFLESLKETLVMSK